VGLKAQNTNAICVSALAAAALVVAASACSHCGSSTVTPATDAATAPSFDAGAGDAGAGDAGGGDAGDAGAGGDSAIAGDASDASARDVITGYTGSGATKGTSAGVLNIGHEFRVVDTGITIRDLGIWDEGANGLNAAHTVTLFSLDKAGTGAVATAVAGGSISVPAGTAAPLDEGFRFAPLPKPIDVAPGYYAVVAYGMDTQDPYGDHGNIPLSTTGIVDAEFDPFQFVTAASPAFPTGGDNQGHTSVSFRYEKQNAKFARILPFGDSITFGTNGTNAGYRGPLGNLLSAHGFAYQFVGVATDNPGKLPKDQVHHEGHPGYIITGGAGAPRAGISDSVDLWLGPTGVNPNIILLMIGTNDVGTNYDLPNAGKRLDAFISKMINKTTGLRPNARLVVAQITPWSNPATDNLAVAYNAQVATVVAQHKAAGENISMVDMHSALGLGDLSDGLHPNDAGYAKMADVWFKAIVGP
jgi:lysophospholipase L1-like esterase